ncbi:MAG TPA: gluconeogenesis factor YvcK family protein [Acidimicrobiales bacterium]|nr:gluconeogenesis factor YvcK family protein [Acidimicrobiales bacterium]
MSRPTVVAVGGGHGTAVTLRAALRYAVQVTGVVSVADDGGSSGRLRELLDVVALGDLRKCLVAVAAEGSALATAFDRRFTEGELAGHPLGNLVLAGLVGTLGDLQGAVDEAGRLLGARGRVLPATTARVVLRSTGRNGAVTGQVAVGAASSIERVELVGRDATAPEAVVEALLAADQIAIGPGSLFTSVLAAASVPGVTEAMHASRAQRVYVCNLRPQLPETAGYTVADHVAALRRHGVPVDLVVVDDGSPMPLGEPGVDVLRAPLVKDNPLAHDPVRLAAALQLALAQSRVAAREAT